MTGRSIPESLPILLVVVLGDCLVEAREPAYLAGDRIVTLYRVPVKDGTETKVFVERGKELTVAAVQGAWLGVRVPREGKTVSGWVYVKHVQPSSRQLSDLGSLSTRYLTQAEFDRVIDLQTTLIRLTPDDAGSYVDRGIAAVGQHDLDNAITDFTAAADAGQREALSFRAWCYLEKGENEKALSDCNKVLAADPNDGPAREFRGRAQLAQGQLDEAIADLSEVLRLNGGTQSYRSLLFYAVQVRLLRTLLASSIVDPPLKDLNIAGPVLADTHYHRGLAYVKKNDRQQALQDFTQAIATGAVPPGVFMARAEIHQQQGDRTRAAQDQILAGVYHLVRGDLEAAVSQAARGLELNSDLAAGYFLRAVCEGLQGEWDRAIDDYQRAAKLAAEMGSLVKVCCAVAYGAQGKAELAIAQYTETIREFPENGWPYLLRGLAYWSQGRMDQGVDDFGEGLRRLDQDATNDLAYLLRGSAYLARGEPDKAAADFSEAVARAPNDALAYYGRGLALHLQGQTEAAAEDLGKQLKPGSQDRLNILIAFCSDVIRQNPKLGEAYVCRGMMLAGTGEPTRALADLDEALRLGTPYGSFVRCQRAMVLAALGSLDQAHAELEKAVRQ